MKVYYIQGVPKKTEPAEINYAVVKNIIHNNVIMIHSSVMT